MTEERGTYNVPEARSAAGPLPSPVYVARVWDGNEPAKANVEAAAIAQSSIEVDRDARGNYSLKVKRYYDQNDPAAKDRARAEIRELMAGLRADYLGGGS